MPWNAGDATRFKKDVSNPARWAEIANAVLREGQDEGQAIRIANLKTRSKAARGIRTT